MAVAEIVAQFVDALDLAKLRVGAPSRFVFFCGGKKSKPVDPPISLRECLLRSLSGKHKIEHAHFVQAESATELYRESKYRDLIKFESDVAQISDIVLLIGESPGSLTELGAFSMNDAIAPRLKVFVQEKYFANSESFIRADPESY